MPRKRFRGSEKEEDEDGDDDLTVGDSAGAPGCMLERGLLRSSSGSGGGGIGESASERKREMEKRRRDLVSQRFSELEIQLQKGNQGEEWMMGSGSSSGGMINGRMGMKRIDKEAVLKEARLKLCRQERKIFELNGRVKDMSAEIDILRQEKLELRKDKDYYRSDVTVLREEISRLRADNFALWQVLRKKMEQQQPRIDSYDLEINNNNNNSNNATKVKGKDSQKNGDFQKTTAQVQKQNDKPLISASTGVTSHAPPTNANIGDQTDDRNIDSFLSARGTMPFFGSGTEELNDVLATLNKHPEAIDPGETDIAYCV